MIAVTDAGQLQQLRRVDRAAGQDDFPFGSHGMEPAVPDIFNADRASIFDQDAGCERLGDDFEVGSAEDRMQITMRRAGALISWASR